MSSKLKALGLTLVAMFALGALATSASAAETFHSDGDHTILTPTANGPQVFTTTAGELICQTVGGSGTTNATETHELTFSPTYSGDCTKEPEGVPLHIEMNGCDYLFTSTKSGEHAPVHIVCPTVGGVSQEITIKATIGGFKLNCVDVPEQTPTGGGVTYDTEGTAPNRDIKVTATVTGITYTETGVCGNKQGANDVNDGTYTGWVTVKGENTASESTDIWWE